MPEPTPAPLVTLPRVLGPFDACMVVVRSVIGSGIFLKPGAAAQHLPNFGLIIGVWIVVGAVTLCGCLAVAELAAMLPQAGGTYVYLREAYGRLAAFLWGWTEFWIIRTGSIGALATATTIYLSEVIPLDRTGQEVVTIGLVMFLCVVNLVGTRWGARVQNVTSVLKIAFLALIIVLPYLLGRADTANLQPLLPSTMDASLWRGITLAAIAVMWPYDGWINVAPVTEEIRDPHRNVPLALVAGFGVVMFVYVAANVSYHLVLPLEEVANSRAVVFDMFKSLFSADTARWVALGVMCSTFGAVNSNLLTGPRILFAMARDGLLPRALSQVHSRYETPANAIILQGLWTTILIFVAFRVSEKPIEVFDNLTNLVVFGGLAFYAMAVAAVYVLRRSWPDVPRPYHTWGYPITPALYLIMAGVVMLSVLWNKPWTALAGIALIAAGVPYYAWIKGKRPE